MISVLICSANPSLLSQVKANIENTIGTEYEILHFDNREANIGICKVYNDLASMARYQYICFLHEDVLFETIGWGSKIMDIFSKDPAIGLLGVAGCKYKSAYSSGWFTNVPELDCAYYSHYNNGGIEKVCLSPSKSLLQEVVSIDGLIMVARKITWQTYPFNERLLTGFHFYDIDFSLRIAHHYKVVVTYDFEIVHITEGGDYGNKWVEAAIKYHEAMKKELPFSKMDVNANELDAKIVRTTLDFLKNHKIRFRNKMKWITSQKLHEHKKYYYSILKFLLYKPLKLRSIHKLFIISKFQNQELTSD
ncbi:MAG: glycosyltransferase [Ginsengibacter sp.]